MSKIPTTGELFKKYSNLLQFEEGDPEYLVDEEDFKTSMIEFAKLHVEAALKAASEKAEISGLWGSDKNWKNDEINTNDQDGEWMLLHPDKESIINAYPPENIK